jgi:hypothetical protein
MVIYREWNNPRLGRKGPENGDDGEIAVKE